MKAPAYAQELVLDDAALDVSVFAGDFVSVGAGLLPESPLLESLPPESLVFDSLLDEVSDVSLDELPFDA
ncbi:MAG: hypothetical protein ABR928_02245 [Terracidiphilus sp.]|jgi:hypothetical protein